MAAMTGGQVLPVAVVVVVAPAGRMLAVDAAGWQQISVCTCCGQVVLFFLVSVLERPIQLMEGACGCQPVLESAVCKSHVVSGPRA